MFETLEFYVGQEVDFAVLPKRLSDFGYTRRDKISAPGEFSVRGGVVDVFPLNFSMPIRMEFSADTLESIHVFDTLSGARLEPHTMVIVLKIRAWQQNLVRNEGLLSVDTAAPIDPFVDIEPGDLVVHVLHGIARYRGIKSLKNKQDKQEDHFVLEFADKNILYVPTRDMHLVQRYIAFGKIKPGLSRLGSRNWERLKEKTKKGVLSFAAELLDMQVKRKALQGLSFQKDTEWQRKLEEEFPYEETEDQVRALEEVKKDLESPVPMDRLLCGDVGYGKTEVALRAAFKAVMSGKQVAILVPTTILAEQHFDTFGSPP